ncbi:MULTISPECIES: methyl-accepting chemotaxis protein [unclassified Undibacterium]|uniref:methyl-accepting chemotaxis protein n=1 Tax=unclassified Undibacterium TaxID=2630295 RepID=UPI002AC99F29|nr:MULTISPECIES: methyl-accepting chemotaxis protein [unclassified Undibacterium]MEB0137801.1 methyl-accepting chemotaxis protein [Undibacterium sp. CCC2.1]MEB0171008.1 methyl-accepting chemotaxis protein [Undibacterium sp. CCC1.1]MEB0175053.1 methyl-accepting chemotaxis protein [Undibacterium sp. CCC3.4]MEB0215169.1 methyl-accepting chemotaxis protein [Undibacterium sp. 5I2]WPX44858.1 methyl-accepting chemotaxis protein [Undibacterium sp. CCC3.4]
MNLRQMRIGTRLAVGFGFIMVSLIVVLIIGSVLSASNRTHMTNGMELAHTKTALAASMKSSMLEGGLAIRNIGLQSDLGEMEKQKLVLKAQHEHFYEARNKLIALGLSNDEKKIVDVISGFDQQVEIPTKEAFKMLLSFNGEEAVKLIATQIDPLQQKALLEINKLVALEDSASAEVSVLASSNANKLVITLLLIGSAILLIGIAFSIFLTRSITGPLQDAVQIAQRVAAGELTHRDADAGHDEISELLNALKEMSDNLFHIVSEVRQGTDAIAIASGEISSGNSDLSSRTETQAGALEETASSMEEITATVRHNADNARQANALVNSASGFAIKGGEEVGKVVHTMNSIKESSRKIVDIISVIDGIAFQTNILALNAAVEAARAGEQGRGFAVVASEVRNLAQRSASAAKEIKTLIGDSVEKVESGGKLVDAAGQTMHEIVSSVKHVADIMSEITAAGQEQSAGIEEVNRAITQMDEMTQQNAALVEQAAAAAESMEEQAGNLARAVAAFKLGSDPRQQLRRASPPPVSETGLNTRQKMVRALGLQQS